MKAVVVEIKNGKAAVLAPDGAINFIKNNNYSPGQYLDTDTAPLSVRTTKYIRTHYKMLAAAAAAFIISGSLFAADGYAYSRMTLDINPSFEYTLNPFDKVIDVTAYNDDAAGFIDRMATVKGMSIERAIGQALDIMEEEQYIKGDTEAVITVSSHFRKEPHLEKKAYRSVDNWNITKSENKDDSRVELEVVELTEDLSDRAGKEHKSPGRIYMEDHGKGMDKTVPEDPDIPVNENKDPVKPENDAENSYAGSEENSPEPGIYDPENRDNKQDNGSVKPSTAPATDRSGQSETHAQPGDPGQFVPEDQGQPENPSAPKDSLQPDFPAQPENLSQPGDPAQPESPSQPGDPTKPEGPSEPSDPTRPEGPSRPESPDGPPDFSPADGPG